MHFFSKVNPRAHSCKLVLIESVPVLYCFTATIRFIMQIWLNKSGPPRGEAGRTMTPGLMEFRGPWA